MVERKEVSIPTNIRQRGTGKEIARPDAIVYDFMPVILGDQFRTDPVLSMQLFRDPPVDGPMMLMRDAYTILGERYLQNDLLTSALECYKFALEQQTGFISFVSTVQKGALLTPQEISHLNLENNFEKDLLKKVAKRGRKINIDLYSAWLDLLRVAHKLEGEYNRDGDNRWSKSNLELQLFMGQFGNGARYGVEYHAKELNDQNLIKRVDLARHGEILDVKWLKKYVGDNHPESSMFRD